MQQLAAKQLVVKQNSRLEVVLKKTKESKPSAVAMRSAAVQLLYLRQHGYA